MAVAESSISLPSWYTTEKETGSTIQKLTDTRELVFYLENPDPFIRRLAIIRIGQLKKKDSFILLNGLLDDTLETEDNRRLAAYFMNKLNEELHLGYFINQPRGSAISANDDDVLIEISITDALPSIKFDFENSLIESQLNFDNEFLKSNIDEGYRIQSFSANHWLSHLSAKFFLSFKKGIRNISGAVISFLFIKGPKRILAYFSLLPKQLKERKKAQPEKHEAVQPRPRKTKPVTYRRKRPETYRLPLGIRIKGVLRGFLNLLFLPFRLLYHLKWALLITLLTLYVIFSFTTPGKSFLFRIYPEAYYQNTRFLSQAGDYINKLIQSNETLADFLGAKETHPPEQSVETEKPTKKLMVTASKGLYLRAEPKSDGSRLVLMKQNTTVEFLGEEKQDGSGGLWYKVRLENDTGWANAQFLKEV